MKPEDAAWLAGLLEGEGCFQASDTRSIAIQIHLNMTDEDVIRRAADLMGGNVNPRYGGEPRYGKKVCWNTTVSGDKAVPVLLAIRPYMGERRSAKITQLLEKRGLE